MSLSQAMTQTFSVQNMQKIVCLLCLFIGFGCANSVKKRQVSFTTGCIVTANKLYRNGQYVSDLTASELSELAQYKKDMEFWSANFEWEMDQWSKRFHQMMSNFDPFGNKPFISPQPQMPNPPDNPSFCPPQPQQAQYSYSLHVNNQQNSNVISMNGCQIQGNSVFINGKLVRQLTPEEQQTIREFRQRLQLWQMEHQRLMEESIRQLNQQMANFNPFDMQISNFNPFNPHSKPLADSHRFQSQIPPPLSIPKLPPPQPPQICITIGK